MFKVELDNGHKVLAHIILPTRPNVTSATYEVRHGEGPGEPLAAAAAALQQAVASRLAARRLHWVHTPGR